MAGPVAAGDLLDKDLAPEDLPYVIKAVSMLSGKWQNIHSCLMITRDRGDILKVHPHIPMRCLITVLNEWLTLGYNMNRIPDPSWKGVVSFVREKNGGDDAIQAGYIEKNIGAISAFDPGMMAKKANAAPLPTDQGPDDFKALVGDVAKELDGVGAKWFEIGVLLGVPVNKLEEIQGTDANNFNLCLEKIVEEWLKTYASTPGRRTWQILADAVEHQAGGGNRLQAKKIVQLSKNARYPQSTVAPEPLPPPQVAPPTQQVRYTPSTVVPGPPPATVQVAPPPRQGELQQQPDPIETEPRKQPEADSSESGEPTAEHDTQLRNPEADGGSKQGDRDGHSKSKGGKRGLDSRQCYDPHPRDKKNKPKQKPRLLHGKTYRTIDQEKGEKPRLPAEDMYTMNSLEPRQSETRTHGIALVINNEHFPDPKKWREGTDKDETNLIETFRFLGYRVEAYHDCTSHEMKQIFDEMRARDHSQHDSFVCCILSHGKEDVILGCDDVPVEVRLLTEKLNSFSCPTLAKKPKLYFLQACRGTRKTAFRRIGTDAGGEAVADDHDFFISFPTLFGRESLRDLDYGTWYIQELCETFCKSATFKELSHMLIKVRGAIVESDEYKFESKGQIPEDINRLTKQLYFF